MLEVAFNYKVKLGWSVLPVARGSKAPSIPVNNKIVPIQWEKYKTELPDDAELITWFKDKTSEDIGIGVICGKLSGIAVVDDDNHDGNFRPAYNSPVKVKTGNNGYHSYFKYPNQELNRQILADQKIEIRGENHFIVLPPTLHAKTDKPYEWDVASEEDLFELLNDLPELPLNILKAQQTEQLYKKFEITEKLNVAEGNRNNSLISLAGKLWSEGIHEDELLLLLQQVNQNYKPPLPTVEVESIFNSIIKLPRKSIQEEAEPEPTVDTTLLKPISIEEIVEVLGQTIKRDDVNKLVTFLCMLSIYTEGSQFNVSFNAPSSTGKSFIPMEVSSLFPKQDVMTLAYSSPTAFFHGAGVWDEERKVIVIDLSQKIIVFQDQPHTELLQKLRPLLSHDSKTFRVQISDRKQKSGLRTKEVEIIGYPAVIFCSAGMKIDEQEGTRFLLLSPEIDSEKIRQAVFTRIEKETDLESYIFKLNSNSLRQGLIQRILAIKQSGVRDVIVKQHKDLILELFWKNIKNPKPRHSRDIARVVSLIKVVAMLNLWFRKRLDDRIEATEEDVRTAFTIWNQVSESQEYNLPPYIFNLYWQIIVPEYLDQNRDKFESEKLGIKREDIRKRYFAETDQLLEENKLRLQILPMLQTAGLLEEHQDKNDRRILRYTPTKVLKNNSELTSRATEEDNSKLVESIFNE